MQNKSQNKFTIILALMGIIIPPAFYFLKFPDFSTTVFDGIVLSLVIFSINPVKLLTNTTANFYSVIPFVAVTFLSYFAIQLEVSVYIVIPVLIGLYIWFIFKMNRDLNWRNTSGNLLNMYTKIKKSYEIEEPEFAKYNYSLFWGIILATSEKLLRFNTIVSLSLPIFFGTAVLSMTLGILENHIPVGSIIASLLLIIVFFRIKPLKLEKGNQLLQVFSHVLSQKDEIENEHQWEFIKKFKDSSMILYILTTLTSVAFLLIASILFLVLIDQVANNSDFTPAVKIISSIFFFLAIIPATLPAYCSIRFLVTKSESNLKIPKMAYLWIAFEILLFFVIKFEPESLSWLDLRNLENFIEKIAIFGFVGTLSLLHVIFTIKSKNYLSVNKNSKIILVVLLAFIPAMMFSLDNNLVLGSMSLILPSWLWYGAITIFGHQNTVHSSKRQKLDLFSLMGCFTVTGIFFIVQDQFYAGVAGFVAVGLVFLLTLSSDKKERIGSIIFGIKKIPVSSELVRPVFHSKVQGFLLKIKHRLQFT